MTLALTVAFLQEHKQCCLVTVECMSTAILASLVTKCGYHYQSLQTVAGMTGVPVMLCWEHEPLSEGVSGKNNRYWGLLLVFSKHSTEINESLQHHWDGREQAVSLLPWEI